MSNSITKNTALMSAAAIGQKIVAFLYFTIIARSIGDTNTGKIYLAMSFTTIFVVFIDLGLTNIFIREAAKYKERISEYFSTVIYTKIILAVLVYIACAASINLLGYESEVKYLVYLSGVTMVFDSLNLSLYGILRALGNLKYEAMGIVGSQVATLVLGVIFLAFKMPLIYFILAYTIPSFLNFCYILSIVSIKHKIALRPRLDMVIVKKFLPIVGPFVLAAIFGRFYNSIDSIILSKIAGNQALGWYSIPSKIMNAFQFIPLALAAAIYPRFSEDYAAQSSRLVQNFIQSMKYLFIISLPISFGIAVLARNIVISMVKIQFVNSVLPLQIMIFGLTFIFLSFPIGALLNACDRQKTQTTIVGLMMLLNIILNLMLIPEYGAVGGAIAALCTNMLMTVIGYLAAAKIQKIPHGQLLSVFFRAFVAALLMGLAVYAVKINFHYIFSIIIGALVYLLMILALRVVTIAEIKSILLKTVK